MGFVPRRILEIIVVNDDIYGEADLLVLNV